MDKELWEIYKKLPVPREYRILCRNCEFWAVSGQGLPSLGEKLLYTGLMGKIDIGWPSCPVCGHVDSLTKVPVFGPPNPRFDPFVLAQREFENE